VGAADPLRPAQVAVDLAAARFVDQGLNVEHPWSKPIVVDSMNRRRSEVQVLFASTIRLYRQFRLSLGDSLKQRKSDFSTFAYPLFSLNRLTPQSQQSFFQDGKWKTRWGKDVMFSGDSSVADRYGA
jgi:hypothetical protein